MICKMNLVLELFLTFLKIGLFTFGGGYAMISIIENNCVEQKKWITHDEMMNITVIATEGIDTEYKKHYTTDDL